MVLTDTPCVPAAVRLKSARDMMSGFHVRSVSRKPAGTLPPDSRVPCGSGVSVPLDRASAVLDTACPSAGSALSWPDSSDSSLSQSMSPKPDGGTGWDTPVPISPRIAASLSWTSDIVATGPVHPAGVMPVRCPGMSHRVRKLSMSVSEGTPGTSSRRGLDSRRTASFSSDRPSHAMPRIRDTDRTGCQKRRDGADICPRRTRDQIPHRNGDTADRKPNAMAADTPDTYQWLKFKLPDTRPTA